MKLSDLTIVVCCNKNDFYLAKICIASIRYFYPAVDIELVKDKGNGDFKTNEIQQLFNIKVLDLGIQKMGWSGAKFHYLYAMPKGKKVLLLDSDIVFLGPFIEEILPIFSNADYIVSEEPEQNPYAEWVKSIYFDVKKVSAIYNEYKYPGFFFNAGQVFATVGAIETETLDQFFDRHNYPYWKNSDLFPLVDQSIYNFLLPLLSSNKKLILKNVSFMLWANNQFINNISLDELKKRKIERGLVHWAGCFRDPLLSKMEGAHILLFFEDFYYSHIALGGLRKFVNMLFALLNYNLKKGFKKLKTLMK